MNYLLDYTCKLSDDNLTLDYRGYHIVFKTIPGTATVETIWEDKTLNFGFGNTLYVDDMKKLIDLKLDTISVFPDLTTIWGARLIWFKNGKSRDIKLIYKDRILKIFLVNNPQELDLQSLILKAKYILINYLNNLNIT